MQQKIQHTILSYYINYELQLFFTPNVPHCVTPIKAFSMLTGEQQGRFFPESMYLPDTQQSSPVFLSVVHCFQQGSQVRHVSLLPLGSTPAGH